MKILTPEEQKEIYKNLLKRQIALAQNLLTESKVSCKPVMQKELETLIVRALHTSYNYNVDASGVIEDIKQILQEKSPYLSLKKYSKNLYQQADKFHDILENTQREGLKQREEVAPNYPDLLKEKSTVYIHIDQTSSAYDMVMQNLEQLNAVLPSEDRLSYDVENNKLKDKKQAYAVGAFFARHQKELGEVIGSEIDFKDESLQKILSEANYPALIELRKNRSLEHNLQNQKLIRLLGQKVMFYQAVDLLKKQHSIDFQAKLTHVLKAMENTYGRTTKMLVFSQQKKAISQDDVSIDTLIVSKHPHMLATQSEYKDWRNCTSADDFNHARVIDGIAQGSIIVYGINSQNPQKKISRILLTPYTNEKGDVVYFANRTYGEYNLSFREQVENLAKQMSSSEKGIYKINPHILPDNAPENLLQFASAEEFCQSAGLDYQKNEQQQIVLKKLNLSRYGLNKIPDFLKNICTEELNLSFNPLTTLENCPQCQVLDISHCDKLDKNIGEQIPLSVKSLNARFSNFNGLGLNKHSNLVELNISNNDAIDSRFLENLPKNLKILKANYTNLTSLKNLPLQLEEVSVNGCELTDVKNVNIASLKAFSNER